MADILEKLEKLTQYISELKERVAKLEAENAELKKSAASMEKNDELAVKKLEELLGKVKDL